MLFKFNNLHQYFWTLELLLIRFATFIMKLLRKDSYYIYNWQFSLHLLLPTIALHETLCEFFMYLYFQLVIKNNILFWKLSLLRYTMKTLWGIENPLTINSILLHLIHLSTNKKKLFSVNSNHISVKLSTTQKLLHLFIYKYSF